MMSSHHLLSPLFPLDASWFTLHGQCPFCSSSHLSFCLIRVSPRLWFTGASILLTLSYVFIFHIHSSNILDLIPSCPVYSTSECMEPSCYNYTSRYLWSYETINMLQNLWVMRPLIDMLQPQVPLIVWDHQHVTAHASTSEWCDLSYDMLQPMWSIIVPLNVYHAIAPLQRHSSPMYTPYFLELSSSLLV